MTAARKIMKAKGFVRNLKQLSKKHPALKSAVENALNRYAVDGATQTSDKIPGMAALPMFKERLRVHDRGCRGGARIIYYCDPDRVVAMFLYLKASQSDVPVREIRDALKSVGLL